MICRSGYFNRHDLFEGVGFCAVLIAFFVSFYYNVIIGWAFHFLFSSLSMRLPWKVDFKN